MKINNIGNHYQNIKQYKLDENLNKNGNVKKDKAVDIEISSAAKKLAEKVEGSKSIEYSEKVEKIREAILDGSYKIDSEKIAEKIIEKIEQQKGRED